MLLVRPRIAGDAPVGVGVPDGIPIASGSYLRVDWAMFGPAVTHEWSCRVFGGPDGAQCVVVEFIWDKAPCRGEGVGKCHSIIRPGTANSEAINWTRICKADPQRYAMLIGCVIQTSAIPLATFAME